jgi:hypothetical protein
MFSLCLLCICARNSIGFASDYAVLAWLLTVTFQSTKISVANNKARTMALREATFCKESHTVA